MGKDESVNNAGTDHCLFQYESDYMKVQSISEHPCTRTNYYSFISLNRADNIQLLPCVEHMVEAWDRRHHPDMCLLFCEEMKRDLRSQIRRVAEFLGKEYSDGRSTNWPNICIPTTLRRIRM